MASYSYNVQQYKEEKLGEGSYGTVYKGRYCFMFGSLLLKIYKDNHQNFLSKVATICRIHRVNDIRCWVYAGMAQRSISLRSGKLLEIAIGVAHGIEYLHDGCDSRILHCNIKPQNVLLD